MFEGGLATNPVRMTGDFETIIAKNDVKMPDASLKGEVLPSGAFDAIYVDLTQAEWFKAPLINPEDAAKAVVYVPLVTTTKNVDIVVSLCRSLVNPGDVTDDFDNGGGPGSNKYEPYKTFKDKKIAKGKVYGNSKQYNLALTAGEGPDEISDALALEEVAEGEDLLIEVEGEINVCDPNNTILIPNKKAASITIDLRKAEVLATCDPTLYVKYKDASGEGKFPGQVTIIAGNTASLPVDMVVNLDSTPFRFVGNEGGDIKTMNIDASAFTLGNQGDWSSNYSNANIALSDNVKTITVGGNATTDDVIATWGDGQNVSSIVVNGIVSGVVDGTAVNYVTTNVTVESYGWFDGGAQVQGATIATNGTVDVKGTALVPTAAITAGGNITFDNNYNASETTAGAITSTGGNVSINNASGNYSIFTADITTGLYAGGADFTITGKAKSDGGTVTTKNAKIDVTPNNGDCEAITNELKYAANGKLELLTGYVGTVNPNGKTVTLSFADKGAWAAMNVTAGAADKVRPGDNVSIWNGKDFANGTLRTTYTATDQIWTATQLGTQSYNWSNTPTTYVPEIRSNIDLDNKDWKGIYADADYALDGQANPAEASKTIKNINLVQNNVSGTYQAGFIAQADASVSADDLTLDGVKTSIKALGGAELKGVGGFIGKSDGDITFNRVNVKLAAGYFGSMDGTKNVDASNIGGVIGRTYGDVILKGVTADLTGAILSGWRSLGGFIGGAKGDISILTDPELGDSPETACAVNGLTQMWVTLLNLGPNENDREQASTGLYIGQVDLAKTIKIEDAADVNPSFTVGGKADENKAFILVSGTPMKINKFTRGDQKLIGQSDYNIQNDVVINGENYNIKKTGESFTDGNKVLYNVVVTTYAP
jgi:hypothetical protein